MRETFPLKREKSPVNLPAADRVHPPNDVGSQVHQKKFSDVFLNLNKGSSMNRTTLLGSLFLRASSVYGGAPIGDLIEESLKRRKKGDRRTEQRPHSKEPKAQPNQEKDPSRRDENDPKTS